MLAAILLAGCSEGPANGTYWAMHTIDDSYEGADGVDLVDVDNDGDADAVVGWEESGALLLHENPGPARVREPWGHTLISGGLTVGKIEDARFLATRDIWDQELVSENRDVYRAEWLAYRMLRKSWAAAVGEIIGTGGIAPVVSAFFVAPVLMGKAIPLLALVPSFLGSTLAGTVLGVLALRLLDRADIIEL